MKKQNDVSPDNEKTRNSGKKGLKDGMDHSPATDTALPDDAIGRGLKRMFDDVVKEPIPPEFLELLNRIDRKCD